MSEKQRPASAKQTEPSKTDSQSNIVDGSSDITSMPLHKAVFENPRDLPPSMVMQLQRKFGNHFVLRMANGQENHTVMQRSLSPHYADITARLSTSVTDWAVTNDDVSQILVWLSALSADDFQDTVYQLEADGHLQTLWDNIGDTHRATHGSLIGRITGLQRRDLIMQRIEQLLATDLTDWAVTDSEAGEILAVLNTLGANRLKMIIFQMIEDTAYDGFVSNISAADRTTYATLVSNIETAHSEYNNTLTGTSPADSATRDDVEAILTPGIARGPRGVPAPFVDVVGGKTYRQEIEEKLDQVRAWMHADAVTMLGRARLPMSQFQAIGDEAKRQTDRLFGQYGTGPSYVAGTNLLDRSAQAPDAADLVRYLINNQSEVLPVHTRHSAIPSRATEAGIIANIITDYTAAHRAQLDTIDRAWPALAYDGIVEIQPYEGATANDTRRGYWDAFQTMIHEYLHNITHDDYEDAAHNAGGVQESILIEGVTSLFTDEVWNAIWPEEIRSNHALRATVEQRAYPFNASVVPAVSHYDQITDARSLEARVGQPNLRAAYFLGRIEMIGISP